MFGGLFPEISGLEAVEGLVGGPLVSVPASPKVEVVEVTSFELAMGCRGSPEIVGQGSGTGSVEVEVVVSREVEVVGSGSCDTPGLSGSPVTSVEADTSVGAEAEQPKL